ncbi:MAG: type II secretion system major pseudopilin GspG, partial [Gammaproteobacteria bacterium]
MQKAITRYPTVFQQGFTLIEIMVVVVILGILAALIAPNVIGRIDEARVTAAGTNIRTIESALQLYRMDNFRYPSTEEGIEALVNKPDDPDIKWPEGGYLQRLPQDPWNRPYLYLH